MKHEPILGENLPVVQSINEFYLEKDQWIKMGKTFTKNGLSLTYNGVHWHLEGSRVNFMQELNNDKTPDENRR